MRTSPQLGAAGAGIVAMILTGSSVAVIGATAALPAFAVQSARYAIAAVLVGGFAVWRGRRKRARDRRSSVEGGAPATRGRAPLLADLAWAAAGAVTGLVGFNLLMIVGVRHAEPAVLGSAVACIPLVLAIIAPLSARRPPSVRLVAGGAVVSAGAVLVTGWGRTDGVGILCACGLIVCEAAFTLCAARAVTRMGAFAYTAWTCAIAAVAFGVLSGTTERVAFDVRAVAPVLYLGVAVTAAAFVLWFTAVGRLGPERAGLCAGVAAPASALTAFALGAPLPSAIVWAGIALIAAGLAVGFAPARRFPRALAGHEPRMSPENVTDERAFTELVRHDRRPEPECVTDERGPAAATPLRRS